jgi:excisionase family DNA binding protein
MRANFIRALKSADEFGEKENLAWSRPPWRQPSYANKPATLCRTFCDLETGIIAGSGVLTGMGRETVKQSGPWSFIAEIEAHAGLMTVDEVAEVLRTSKFTIYRMAQRKQLPSLVIGGSRRFDPAALGMHFRKKSPESAAAAKIATRERIPALSTWEVNQTN